MELNHFRCYVQFVGGKSCEELTIGILNQFCSPNSHAVDKKKFFMFFWARKKSNFHSLFIGLSSSLHNVFGKCIRIQNHPRTISLKVQNQKFCNACLLLKIFHLFQKKTQQIYTTTNFNIYNHHHSAIFCTKIPSKKK